MLFAKECEVAILAVHCKTTRACMKDTVGGVTSTGYNVGSVLSEGFLHVTPALTTKHPFTQTANLDTLIWIKPGLSMVCVHTVN